MSSIRMSRAKQVVLTDGFLKGAYELPKEAAKKVFKALQFFIQNRQHPGLNLESLGGPGELHSIRVDDSIRIILENSDSPVLMFVGPHDEAYRFAGRWRPQVQELGAPVLSSGALFSTSEEALQETLASDARIPLPHEQIKPFLTHTRKYFPLTRHLIRLQRDLVTLSFKQIEKILGDSLPASARRWDCLVGERCSAHSGTCVAYHRL